MLYGKTSSQEFVIYPNPKTHGSDLTVVISKKVAKRAVDRNRIKRIVKEALRGYHIGKEKLTIVVKKNIADLKMPEVKVKLKKLLKNL